MKLIDYFYVDETIVIDPRSVDSPTGPRRFRTPVFTVLLENTESARTVNWGLDGLDLRGVEARFALNSSTGGTVLEGMRFVGSFSARVTAQRDGVLSLAFEQVDKGLRRRLMVGGGSPR